MKPHISQPICVFKPADLDLLARVLSRSSFRDDDKDERDDLAFEAITLFQSGITDELTLIKMLTYSRISMKEA